MHLPQPRGPNSLGVACTNEKLDSYISIWKLNFQNFVTKSEIPRKAVETLNVSRLVFGRCSVRILVRTPNVVYQSVPSNAGLVTCIWQRHNLIPRDIFLFFSCLSTIFIPILTPAHPRYLLVLMRTHIHKSSSLRVR
jgi:hypothetical protein